MGEGKDTSTVRTLIVVGLIIAALFLFFSSRTGIRDGRIVFKDEGCVKCHVYKDTGIGIIDLTKVTERRSDTWIRDQIRYPRKHDRGSGMPSFDHLPDEELDNLLDFLHGREEGGRDH